jgi:hypothetical protein
VSDLHSQQLTRPRIKSDNRRIQRVPVEDLPKFESRSRRWMGGRDGISSCRHTVLIKMIAKNVGRPWDDVYSDLLKKFKRNRYADRLTLQSIDYHVEKDCTEVKPGVFRDSRGHSLVGVRFYINPKTKILCENKSYRNYGKPKKDAPNYIRTKGHHYHKIDGVWYEVSWQKSNSMDAPSIGDVVLEESYKNADDGVCFLELRKYSTNNYRRKLTYCYLHSKRQLNKKEIKRLITPMLQR